MKMAKGETKEPTRFEVNLGNLELPPVVAREIESEIRAVVLRALARLDTQPSSRLDPTVFGNFKGGTLGLWIDPEHPDKGSWEDTVPALRIAEGGITPFVTRNKGLFPARLASTKASGAEAILISVTKEYLQLDQLDGRGQAIASFVMHPTRDSKTNKFTSVKITRTDSNSDSDGTSSSLGPRDRVALATIADELSPIADEYSSGGVIYFWKQLFHATVAGFTCAVAAAELGVNVVADAECAVGVSEVVGDVIEDDE
jgi:hypothetical protein